MASRCIVCSKGLTHIPRAEWVKVDGRGYVHPQCEDQPLPTAGVNEKPDWQGGMQDRRRSLLAGSLHRR